MKHVLAWRGKPPIECAALEANASGISGKGKRHRFHPVLFVAFTLLIILALGLAIHAMGYGVQRLFVSWDDGTMKVRFNAQGNFTWHKYKNDMEPAFDDAFFQKLEELEMMPLMPSWMPEGLELESADGKVVNENNRWTAGYYSCDNKDILIFVSKSILVNTGGILSLE